MKILQVSSYYAPAFSFGGPPRVMYDLAKELARRGHQVSVFTSDALDVRETRKRISTQREILDGIEIIRFPRLGPYLPSKFLRVIVKDFKKEIRERVKDFEIVHLSEVRNYMNMAASKAACKASIPYFISIFGNLAAQSPFYKRGLIYLYDKIWTEKMFHRSSGLLVQNEHEKQVCLQYGISPAQAQFSPLPIQPSIYKDLPPRGLFRKKFNISCESKIIISLGRLHRDKGFLFLIEAFDSIADKGNNILVLVGADEGFGQSLKEEVEKLKLKNKVLFPGALYNRDKLEAFMDSDIFALTPLVYEETSLAALEACACGLPVIVSERNSIPWLEEYKAGLEISHNKEELVQALELLLSDEKRRREMGKMARLMIEDKFSVEKVVQNLENIFQKATLSGDCSENTSVN